MNFITILVDLSLLLQVLFKSKDYENEIISRFISAACIMDSLISNWKIRTTIPKKLVESEDLVLLNCKLAVSVALSVCGLSNIKTDKNIYIKRLVECLSICYYNKNFANRTIIEYEAMILELLYNDFQKSE